MNRAIYSFLILLFYFFSYKSFCGEIFPEYRSLKAHETKELQDATEIDSEYQSDLLTFEKPFAWNHQWLTNQNAFDLSVGSLSGKRFAFNNRLKINKSINEFIDFGFVFFKQGDYEEQASASIIELSFWIDTAKSWAVAIYGEGSTYKSEDDLGLAILFRPRENVLHRWFYTAPDFSRNQRNEQDDRFLHSPSSYGWVSRWWSADDSEFFEWAVRDDKETTWSFPSENQTYIYSKRYLSVKMRESLGGGRYLNSEVNFVKRLEILDIRVEYLKESYLLQHEGTRAWGGEWLFGVQYVDRTWRQTSGEVRHKNILPHLWWNQEKWGVGYETTAFSARGPARLRSSLDDESFQSEHRMNVSYKFSFEQAELKGLLTFDLDRLGSGETWEGGNAQFISWF